MREFGLLRKLPSGRWQARYVHPRTNERITGPITFERRTDATRWLVTVEADIVRGIENGPLRAREVSTAAWAETWLASDPNKRPRCWPVIAKPSATSSPNSATGASMP